MSVYDSTRHTGKTKESSVNWSFPDQHSVEVLDGTKGKLDGYVIVHRTTPFKECSAAVLSLVANNNFVLSHHRFKSLPEQRF